MWLTHLFSVLRAGQELSNSETWKNRSVAINAVTALLMALAGAAKGFGYEIPMDESTAALLAGGVLGVVALYNAFMLVATSARVGLPPKS